MNLQEIKEAVRSGKTVHWSNVGYVVKLHVSRGEEFWSIVCLSNNHAIGLTNLDETKMNGDEKDFYIAE